MPKVTIYWHILINNDKYRKIKDRFGLSGMTVNGESVGDISQSDYPLFLECAKRGFFTIRNKPIKDDEKNNPIKDDEKNNGISKR